MFDKNIVYLNLIMKTGKLAKWANFIALKLIKICLLLRLIKLFV